MIFTQSKVSSIEHDIIRALIDHQNKDLWLHNLSILENNFEGLQGISCLVKQLYLSKEPKMTKNQKSHHSWMKQEVWDRYQNRHLKLPKLPQTTCRSSIWRLNFDNSLLVWNLNRPMKLSLNFKSCLLYTSDAADE